jgi:mycothione reductase
MVEGFASGAGRGGRRHHEVVVIGAGSGNMVIDDLSAEFDVAIVEERRFGVTCLNFGCIP